MPLSQKHKLNWTHLFFTLLLIFYAFILVRPIDLTTQDIGRHLANGREIMSGRWQVLYQNHYSYTLPEHSFVNHHWLFGVANYLVYLIFSFQGVHVLYIITALTAAGLFFKLIKNSSNSFISLLLGLPAILFLSTRTEIRPEALGLLFFIHTLWQLNQVQNTNKITKYQIALLLLQQLIWVNWHISFVFGIALVAMMWLCSSLFHSPNFDQKTNVWLLKTWIALTATSLLNPNFLKGLLQPLAIFSDYGYSIVENQTLLFLWNVIRMPTIFSYLAFSLPALLLLIFKGRRLNMFETCQLLLGILLGFAALRNIPLFVVLSFPILSKLLILTWKDFNSKVELSISPSQPVLMISLFYSLFAILLAAGFLVPSAKIDNRYLGRRTQDRRAAAHIKSLPIKQPIFNNYDLGSYIIFHFYPETKVFTDNRPEAYGKKFFQEKYIPMQQNQQVWHDMMQTYQFKTVIFGVRDITPWGRSFLQFIKNEPSWEQIYQDQKIAVYTWQNHQQD